MSNETAQENVKQTVPESKIDTETIRETIREEIQEAVDPKVLAKEVNNAVKEQKAEEDSIMQDVASQYDDFYDVYTDKKFQAFQKENKDEASDIIYFYQQGDKARAYERAYKSLKKWETAKKDTPQSQPPKEQKKEQKIPEDRDPTIVGGALKDPVGIPPMNTIGILKNKHPSLRGKKDALVEGKIRVPRTHAEVRAIRDDALNRITSYRNELNP